MPALFYFCASALAAVVTTGVVLDKLNVRRSRRALVWWGLSLLPFFLLFLLLVFLRLVLGPFKWPC